MPDPAHRNQLVHETSPYLLQHAHNPVNWFPWGDEARRKAKREQKPIFLSIGYSACHWCHVMERESFEDLATAEIMNAHFVNIKVDREERPDLDQIYMNAVQVLTQHGGWPMSVFLTPDLEPFYGGTYFPPEDKMGMPSFKKILQGVAHAWITRRAEIVTSAKQLTTALQGMQINDPAADSGGGLTIPLLDEAALAVSQNFDPKFGGYGSAPKFFHTMDLRADLRHFRRTGNQASLARVTLTLHQLANGGVYDQLGGGFHRYSTDQRWLAPHFEKMLYDNALLSETYLEAYQIDRNPEWARVARETLNYVLREMTAEDGAFFSTQDADTEDVEGRFYVWSRKEIFELLDAEMAEQFCKFYDVTDSGNWEATNILNRPQSLEYWAGNLGVEKDWLEDSLALAQRKLFAARANRPAPFRDEKILVSWNGLMIHAMALGYQILGDDRYLKTASGAADFILNTMRVDDKLLHVYKNGHARLTAYLDDYANLVHGLISLYESDFQPKWLESAITLSNVMVDQFWDRKAAEFYYTARDHEKLITRPKEVHDGATPSATAMAITALSRLGKLTGKSEFSSIAELALKSMLPVFRLAPQAGGQALIALDSLLFRPLEIVVAADKDPETLETALRKIRLRFLPGKVVALVSTDKKYQEAMKSLTALVDGKIAKEGETTVYFCENFSCRAPVKMSELDQALEQW